MISTIFDRSFEGFVVANLVNLAPSDPQPASVREVFEDTIRTESVRDIVVNLIRRRTEGNLKALGIRGHVVGVLVLHDHSHDDAVGQVIG